MTRIALHRPLLTRGRMLPTSPEATTSTLTLLPMECHQHQHQSMWRLPPALEVAAAKALPLLDANQQLSATAGNLTIHAGVSDTGCLIKF